MPAGDAAESGSLSSISVTGELSFEDMPDLVEADEEDQIHAIGGQPGGPGRTFKQSQPRDGKGTKLQNECDFCDAWGCQSKEKGGPTKCICRWDSKFDLRTKLTNGQANYCKMARGWHGEHKEAKTLKGVRFTVRKAHVDDKDAKNSMAKGSMSAIVEFRSLFGEEDIDDPVAFDKWLSDMDADAPGISALGDLRREEGLLPTDALVIEGSVAIDEDKVSPGSGESAITLLALKEAQEAVQSTELDAARSKERANQLARQNAELRAERDAAIGKAKVHDATPVRSTINPALVPPPSPAYTLLSPRANASGGAHETPATKYKKDKKNDMTVAEHLATAILITERKLKVKENTRSIVKKAEGTR